MFDSRKWLVCVKESERDVFWCCGVLTHIVLVWLRMCDVRLKEQLVCLEAKLAIPVSDLGAVGL